MSGDDLAGLAARELGLSFSDVSRIVRTAPKRYKVYNIPKRSGGERTIAQPSRELKDLQYFLMARVLSALPIHPAATAYREGLNIRDNALPHVHSTVLLKMDLIDFFGSIKAFDFVQHCADNGLDLANDDMEFCCQVLFWRERRGEPLRLSIGAPSSPMLSNSIVYRMDCAIAELCAAEGVTYTRYADDLTFSSNQLEPIFKIRQSVPVLLRHLRYPILFVNHEKTVLVTKKYRRMVTGLVIANDESVSLGHERKRKLRATLHAFVRGALNEDDVQALRGQLAFCNSVEPEFLTRMRLKYGERTLDKIMKGPIRKRYPL
jgi:hypothetical protein